MENKENILRLVLAIVLSFVVILGFQLLFKGTRPAPKPSVPAEAGPATQMPGTTPQVQAEAPKAEAAKPVPATEQPAATETGPQKAEGPQAVTVITPLYTAEWSNLGGVLKSWKLARYKDSKKQDLELVSDRATPGAYPFSLGLEDNDLAASLNSKEFFAVQAVPGLSDNRMDLKAGETGEIKFVYSDGASVRAEKVFRLKGGSYAIDVDIKIWKAGRPVAASFLWGPGLGNPSPGELSQRYTAARGAAYHIGNRVQRRTEGKTKPGPGQPTFVDWAAYEDQYFAALFVPPGRTGVADFIAREPVAGAAEAAPGAAPAKPAEGPKGDYFLYISGEPGSPGGPVLGYIGPKESEALVAFGHDTKAVVNYSRFIGVNLKPIAELMLVATRFFYKLIPNWGVAIILLTLAIKIIFFPLTYSSTKSMAKMAELQPKVKAIRSKYKKAKTDIDQRRQMNEEMMKLYKEQGVNPAGGCLPLLIQMPVFVAVYQMLVAAIEFRHSPFISFWISDLSVRDKTFVLPLLMGGTQYISQKMTPTSADPAQARMMLFMPVIMTGIFAFAQSGLVLYWLTSNVLQIGQQALMNKMMHRAKEKAKDKAKAR